MAFDCIFMLVEINSAAKAVICMKISFVLKINSF